jgi:DNA-directed RNA polymerase subunit M/transcription elongation factor TFIIS
MRNWVLSKMTSAFCETCGTLITARRTGADRKLIFWCQTCNKEIINSVKIDKKAFQEHSKILHTEKDKTRIIDGEAPPIPKIMTQTYKQRRKRRCRHPRAIFQGFYQFSSGDEASRKYWYCPDCGQVFRFSGKTEVKLNRKLVSIKKKKNEERTDEKPSLKDF